MAKVDLDLVKHAAMNLSLDARQTAELISEIQELAKQAAAEKPERDGIRKRPFVLIYDPNGELKGKAWKAVAVRVPEDLTDYSSVLPGIVAAAMSFNCTKRGRRCPVKNVADAVENVPARFFRDHNIWKLSKDLVYALPMSGFLDASQSVMDLSEDTEDDDAARFGNVTVGRAAAYKD